MIIQKRLLIVCFLLLIPLSSSCIKRGIGTSEIPRYPEPVTISNSPQICIVDDTDKIFIATTGSDKISYLFKIGLEAKGYQVIYNCDNASVSLKLKVLRYRTNTKYKRRIGLTTSDSIVPIDFGDVVFNVEFYSNDMRISNARLSAKKYNLSQEELAGKLIISYLQKIPENASTIKAN